MHIALVKLTVHSVLPSLENMINQMIKKEEEFKDIIKIGRTHLQDAVPLSLAQSFSSFTALLRHSRDEIFLALDPLYDLAIGGTAVGTGLNTPEDFAEHVDISTYAALPFNPTKNTFAALSGHAPCVQLMTHSKT